MESAGQPQQDRGVLQRGLIRTGTGRRTTRLTSDGQRTGTPARRSPVYAIGKGRGAGSPADMTTLILRVNYWLNDGKVFIFACLKREKADMRTKVKDLLKSEPCGEVVAKGWVRTKRGNRNIAFIALNDGFYDKQYTDCG